MHLRVVAALLLSIAAAPAVAHTPFLAPVSFQVREGGTVSLDAGFAEEFFVPEVAFDNSEFQVIGPDGVAKPAARVERLKTRTVVEHTLDGGKGTYRFSTGTRLGAVFRTFDLDGKSQTGRDDGKPLPKGATLTSHYQTLSRSEVYLTAGAPDRAALKPYGTGLELVPDTHPGDLYAGEHFDFTVLYDGKPLPAQKVEVFHATGTRASGEAVTTVTTDAQGKARLPLGQAGAYLALLRHRGDAPAGAAAPQYGNNYTLTFQVQEQ